MTDYCVSSSRAVFVDSNSSCQSGVASARQIFTGKKTSPPSSICTGNNTASGNDKNFVHEQLTPVTSVTISHNLEKYPTPMILDLLGSEIWGGVIQLDINTVALEFSEAVAFRVTFN